VRDIQEAEVVLTGSRREDKRGVSDNAADVDINAVIGHVTSCHTAQYISE